MIKTLSAEQSVSNVTSKFSVKRYNKFDMKASVMGAFIFYNSQAKSTSLIDTKINNKAELGNTVFRYDRFQVDDVSGKLIIK